MYPWLDVFVDKLCWKLDSSILMAALALTFWWQNSHCLDGAALPFLPIKNMLDCSLVNRASLGIAVSRHFRLQFLRCAAARLQFCRR